MSTHQIPLDAFMGAVEQQMQLGGLGSTPTDALSYITDLNRDMDEMPTSALPALHDEVAVLTQLSNGQQPDLAKYHAAANAIETLCQQYR